MMMRIGRIYIDSNIRVHPRNPFLRKRHKVILMKLIYFRQDLQDRQDWI